MKTKLVGNTHIVAGTPDIVPSLVSFLKKEGIETDANPDAYIRTYRSFGIDEARELRDRAASRALGERRVFIIATPSMTTEAQNALLKTLEEPPADALFFFVLASPEMLLPTLRSRMQVLIIDAKKGKGEGVDTTQFLGASPQMRLDLLKPLLEKGEDDKRDLGAILELLSSLERELANQKKVDTNGLKALYRARAYLGDKGALVKPLLEQMALLLPKV